jgi:hypothetical protein
MEDVVGLLEVFRMAAISTDYHSNSPVALWNTYLIEVRDGKQDILRVR